MGMPKLQFTPEAIWSLVANHLEKVVILIVIICSFPLVLSGINALRLKTRSPKEEPAEIIKQANNASNLLSRPLPADQQAKLNKSFKSASIDPVSITALWNPSEIATPSIDVGFSRPVLSGIEKRKTPTIFPLEDLFATAGIVARANRNSDQRNSSMEMGFDSEMGMGPDSEIGMGPDSEMGYQENPQQVVSPPATKMPYLILSGLIPYKKQMEEYYSLYGPPDATSSIRNIPIWHDFRVDRLEVGPTGDGHWKAVDIGNLRRDLEANWTGYATSPLPQQFRIPETQNPHFYSGFPLGYWGGLPVLAAKPTLGTSAGYEGGYGEDPGASWGLEGIHPWVKDEIKRLVEEQKQLTLQQQEDSRFSGEGMYSGEEVGMGRTSVTSKTEFSPFSDSQTGMDGEMDGGEYYGDQEMSGMDGEGALPDQEYCIFRLVDTSVKPGHSYRYKVTLRVWNPNYEFPKKFLEEPMSSEVKYVKSATSQVYPPLEDNPILVPADKQLFTRILLSSQASQFGLKGGGNKIELLVLDSNPDSGNFELQSIESVPGNIIGAKKGDRKIRNRFDPKNPFFVPPYDVDSDQTLLAMAGEQIIQVNSKKWVPPDPFEVLTVDERGNLALITPDASEELVKDYLPTIPGYQPSTANEGYEEGM